MSFTNIKNNNQGFTIVELLIVVVVIAILAAITIVSYNGITNKANASAAASTAATLQKKAELYQADKGAYPTALTQLTASADSDKSYYIASGTIKTATTNPDSTNGKNTVKVVPCGTDKGLQITWYNWTSTAQVINVGDTSGTCTGTWAAA